AFATSSSQSPQNAAAAHPERIPQIASAWHAAWTGDDPNALAELFTKTGTYIDLAVPHTSQGREEIAEFKATTDWLIP
ncbi:nuclear transport factor 2 family protein, partial [Streptomyces sp. NRRL S-15]|uniref:nuclear transport factor 2 family protein n=1 Tax=Streptomyces sp. NRRL S-15 TaxID=1463886 RepID=UPI0005B41187